MTSLPPSLPRKRQRGKGNEIWLVKQCLPLRPFKGRLRHLRSEEGEGRVVVRGQPAAGRAALDRGARVGAGGRLVLLREAAAAMRKGAGGMRRARDGAMARAARESLCKRGPLRRDSRQPPEHLGREAAACMMTRHDFRGVMTADKSAWDCG